jgi:pyruvate,water dikinase
MNVVIRDEQMRDRAKVGNKAATLAQLMSAGFDVPPFIVLDAPTLLSASSQVQVESAIASALSRFGDSNLRFAVRSSSVEEDGRQSSFAGQFASFLFVARDRIHEHAMRVIASAASDHIDTYRKAIGQSGNAALPAVIVQEMVYADVAGIAFAADPVSGNRNHAVIAATVGTGDALVSGEQQGDSWRVARSGEIRERQIDGTRAVLNDQQILAVAELVNAVSTHQGRPQDIEWAIRNDRLFLLQSRDITNLGASASGDAYALWDNSNIVESYGGVTTPLTFSIARAAYQEAYRHLGRMLGVSRKSIALNERAYEQMIGLIQGRVYYNLLNWYRLLMLTPGFRFNRRFMEQMMGVTEGLPTGAIPKLADDSASARLRGAIGLLRVAVRLASGLLSHNRAVRQFHRTLEQLLAPVDPASLSLTELVDYFEALQLAVIPAWKTPLVNDLYCMIFHGALRQLSERWLGSELSEIHNELVAGESGIISLEPVQRMREMAGIAAADPRLVHALCISSVDDIEIRIRSVENFYVAYKDYIDKFGDRCLDELKLESQTLKDNPLPLFRGIGHLAGMTTQLPVADFRRSLAEEKVQRVLENRPLKKCLFNQVLRLARARVRDRENLRFERTRVYGRVRSIFLEIGRRLESKKVIADSSDIFYLDVGEITGFVRGTGVMSRLMPLVRERRKEFAEYAAGAEPPRRFVTCGPAQWPDSIKPQPETGSDSGIDCRQGQACSPGLVRGPVRIVRDPRESELRSGEILVAQRTDPGWVTIFPLVTGMIMERGSLLSHSAIVARELGIPAVVGVDNACRWLKDGDWVELDGALGTIRRIEPTERAA